MLCQKSVLINIFPYSTSLKINHKIIIYSISSPFYNGQNTLTEISVQIYANKFKMQKIF